MIWNKYSVKLFVYLIFLTLVGFGFFWSLYSSQLVITKIVFLLGFIFIFAALLKYLNKTNRDLSQFIDAILYVDNVPVNGSSDLSHNRLQITYNAIIDKLKEAKLAKESEHQHFRFVLEHIGIGIISFDKDGKVEIYNKSAKEIFGQENLANVLDLNTLKENLGDELFKLKSGQTKLLKFGGKVEHYKILARSTEIKIENKSLNLISLQNIKTQLEESELEAWQKLIRVLTHEIMNSVTPIKSLTYSMQKALSAETEKPLDLDSILKGLNAIENRSKGLLGFVESYKNLTQIPKPAYERVNINNLFDSTLDLFKDELKSQNIVISKNVFPNNLTILADGKLLSQVIINLIKNSIYAMEGSEDKKLNLQGETTEEDKVMILISDSGKGISDEIIDKIFVPFFTTREKGSGIGLSLARQIMVMHNGNMEVQSTQGKGTTFTLSF
jgi:nitrogen fixation/metabolism regulation signal transduction histidine kinase